MIKSEALRSEAKNASMYWQWVYWLEDCDKDRLLLQVMRIMDIRGRQRRALKRWACEKGGER